MNRFLAVAVGGGLVATGWVGLMERNTDVGPLGLLMFAAAIAGLIILIGATLSK